MRHLVPASIAFVASMTVALPAGSASAASIESVASPQTAISPSIVFMGKPAAAAPAPAGQAEDATPEPQAQASPREVFAPGTTISPSLIALGEPGAEPAGTAGADRKDSSRPMREIMPMVMRGGVWGDAFAPTATAALPPPAGEPAYESEPEQAHHEMTSGEAAPEMGSDTDPAMDSGMASGHQQQASAPPLSTPAPGVGRID